MPNMREAVPARRLAAVVVMAAFAVMALPSTAFAHVSAQNTVSPSGGRGHIDMRVPHGCAGATTRVFTVQIPDGVVGVKPELKPGGWEVSTTVGPITPYESHGTTISEGVTSVTWTALPGNELPDDRFMDFGMLAMFPDLGAGEVLYFPAVQLCVDGSEAAWIEIPEPGSTERLAYPAPRVTLTEGTAGHSPAAPAEVDVDDVVEAVLRRVDVDTAVDTAVDSALDARGTVAEPSGSSSTAGVIAGILAGVIAGGAAGFAASRRG